MYAIRSYYGSKKYLEYKIQSSIGKQNLKFLKGEDQSKSKYNPSKETLLPKNTYLFFEP